MGNIGALSVVSVSGLRPGAVVGRLPVHYVGRGCGQWQASALGNPFRVGQHGSRQQVISRYRSWLWGVVQAGLSGQSSPAWAELQLLVVQVQAGQSLALGCWCHPLPCHASVVRSAVLWLARGQQ